jgi:2-aminoethylphosphonate-pyruvate transaminase
MKNLLFNPGPTNVSTEVRQSLSCQDMCHREPEFQEILKRVNRNMLKSLQLDDTYSSILFASSGTGCNEAVINCIHGKILLLRNGKYSERLYEIAMKYKIPVRVLDFGLKISENLAHLEKILMKDNEISHIVFVHHETTTGMLLPIHEIGQLAEKYGKLTVVDAISSLGGQYINFIEDHVTFLTVNANKCLESFPGVSFVIGETDEILKMKGKARSYYFDLYSHWQKEQEGSTPFTIPVQLVCALDKALELFLKEGYQNRVERYRNLANKLRSEMSKLGFKLNMLPPNIQSNIITSIEIPKQMDYWKFHSLLKKRGITIYSDDTVLSKNEFRIASLGSTLIEDIELLSKNIKEILVEMEIELS